MCAGFLDGTGNRGSSRAEGGELVRSGQPSKGMFMRYAMIVLPLFMFSSRFCSGQDTKPASATSEATALYMQAVAAYREKDYAKSLELCFQSLDKGAKRGTVPYHMACCYALTDKPDDAFKYLNLAFERGWRDVDHLQVDADLATLRADERWTAAVKACTDAREKYFGSLKEPALARELLERMAKDQRARFGLEEKFKSLPPGQPGLLPHELSDDLNVEKIDRDNTAHMKTVIDKHGWPGKSMVGDEASQAAWLLVQHADLEPDFQAKCLDLIKEAFKKGDATGQQVAYLTDRVLLKQGKKQLYGTQFIGFGNDVKPQPIGDEANLDARRAEMGLGPMAEYEKIMKGGK